MPKKVQITTHQNIKKKIMIPYISGIYYDNNENKNEKSKYLNELRIKYEILEDNELKKKDELLDDFINDDKLISTNLNSYKCKNHENKNGEKYCLKCHCWLCEECVDEHQENKTLHPLNDNEINLIEICSEHNKNLTLYCNDCKKFICHECLKNDHNEHSYEKIKDKWRNEKNKYKFFYQENIDDLINDSKDYLNKYSKKTIDFINKIINDLNGIKISIKESVEKLKDDHESIKKLCIKMNEYMKFARNYPNNKIIESIKNLNLQDSNFKLSYEAQNDNAINLLKDEIYNTLNQFIIFTPNQNIEDEKDNKNKISTGSKNLNKNNIISFSSNSIFGNNNNTNGLFSNNTNVYTIKETRKINPFENIKKDLEKKTEEKINKEIKKNKELIINNNNNSFNTLNSSIASLKTQYSESVPDEIVYITSSGSCYHNKYCRYLWKSCIPIKKKDAISRGYHSCSRC